MIWFIIQSSLYTHPLCVSHSFFVASQEDAKKRMRSEGEEREDGKIDSIVSYIWMGHKRVKVSSPFQSSPFLLPRVLSYVFFSHSSTSPFKLCIKEGVWWHWICVYSFSPFNFLPDFPPFIHIFLPSYSPFLDFCFTRQTFFPLEKIEVQSSLFSSFNGIQWKSSMEEEEKMFIDSKIREGERSVR